MSDESGYIYFPHSDGDGSFVLQDPCLLDCPTGNEIITLIIDRVHPRFLFVSIGGEMRRAIDFLSLNLHFTTREEAYSFLETMRDSDFFRDMVRDEETLNQEWDAL